jgi:hypothetical protein
MSQGESGWALRGSRARSPPINGSRNGLSLRYFELPSTQPFRLALVDPTDGYLRINHYRLNEFLHHIKGGRE